MTRDSLRKLHSMTGLVPLGLYLCFHAWEQWPVIEDRDALYARLGRTAFVPFEIALVLLPLLVHAALGLRLTREPDDSPAYASPAFRRFQAITGVVTALFLVWHVTFVWGARALSGLAPSAVAALLEQAGTTFGASLYVVALGAVCVHFGQGLSAVVLRYRPDLRPRPVRVLGGVVGVLFWLVFLNELAAYAAGAPLV